ncbi:hypothetical protein G6F57_021746 [Rhizopus arrhizus]|nr:hypothetical protein G6F57_021746 [Rhizopus arrhizus]
MADMISGTARSHGAFDTSCDRSAYIGNRGERAVAVAVDPSGKLNYGTDHVGAEHLVAILGKQVSDEYLEELRNDGVSYLFAGADGQDLHSAMATLGDEFGIETVLLEGACWCIPASMGWPEYPAFSSTTAHRPMNCLRPGALCAC